MTTSILGIASAIPELEAPPSRFNAFARKWAKPSKPLDKTLLVNGFTQIENRASIHDEDSTLLNRPTPPPIEDICATFSDAGVSLALRACNDAILDWGQSKDEITHLICTTCTGSSHPGYDLFLHQRLGLNSDVERTLLHGIGCAGGLSILRYAKQICLSAEMMGSKARVLVVALEIASSMLRTELQSIDEEAERGGKMPNIASVIFSDAASAMIVGSGELIENEHASFEVLECITETVPESAEHLRFNIRESGWRAVLTPRVPELVGAAVPLTFERLLRTASKRLTGSPSQSRAVLDSLFPSIPAKDFDWFIHTGGSLIIDAITEVMSLAGPKTDKSQTAASWDRYKERGNSSSASIGGVIERGREIGGRDKVVAVSFGPGISVEMCLLRRRDWKGRPRSIAGREQNGDSNGMSNGHGKRKREADDGVADSSEKAANGHSVSNGDHRLERGDIASTMSENGTNDTQLEP